MACWNTNDRALHHQRLRGISEAPGSSIHTRAPTFPTPVPYANHNGYIYLNTKLHRDISYGLRFSATLMCLRSATAQNIALMEIRAFNLLFLQITLALELRAGVCTLRWASRHGCLAECDRVIADPHYAKYRLLEVYPLRHLGQHSHLRDQLATISEQLCQAIVLDRLMARAHTHIPVERRV